ncbi:MAG: hypothetical protein INR71_00765 [Terriglobus roseus]|nr:hypothetical protein [Terriglobus roseus]
MAESPAPDESQFLSKKRNRKLSWVGVDEDTPYGYLRESMVSSLMGGICDPHFVTNEMNPQCVFAPDQSKLCPRMKSLTL